MLNNFEALLNGIIQSKGLDLNKKKDCEKIGKLALKLYNKINKTNVKSKSPKIMVFKVDCRKQKNIA